MLAFARRNIVEGSTIFTDEMTGFLGLRKAGYVPREQPFARICAKASTRSSH
jgi:hypothetical protein